MVLQHAERLNADAAVSYNFIPPTVLGDWGWEVRGLGDEGGWLVGGADGWNVANKLWHMQLCSLMKLLLGVCLQYNLCM